MVTPPLAAVDWPDSRRIIRTIYPPVWLFEDIADPADWDLIASAEAKTNPRVRDQIGEIRLVPVARRLAGPTASLAMSPFTHVSSDRPSRFSDGSFGVWYGGETFEVALMETAYHFERFMRRTAEPTADAQFRELTVRVCGRLADLSEGFAQALDPDDWSAGQVLGQQLRRAGGDGILYPSVRWPAGRAVALFWPDLLTLPVVQARTLHYHWDGRRMTGYFIVGGTDWFALPGPLAAGTAP